jgi:uncharacterized protein YbbC (DUF1343 family)
LDCGGINIIVTDRNVFVSVRTGIEIAAALRRLYPSDWQVEKYGRLLVNQEILSAITRGDSPAEVDEMVRPKIDEFIKRRAPFLLYK